MPSLCTLRQCDLRVVPRFRCPSFLTCRPLRPRGDRNRFVPDMRFPPEEQLLPFELYIRRHPVAFLQLGPWRGIIEGRMTLPPRVRGLFLSPGIGGIWFSRARGELRLEARSAEERRMSTMQGTMPEGRMVISKFNQEPGVRI
jgi:hypothetical protein